MMRLFRWLLLTLALLPVWAGAQSVLDRTLEPFPLVDPGPMPGVTIIDKNTSRPAVVLHGTSFTCSKIVRTTDGDVYLAHPPRPASQIDYSSNDYAEAGVVLFGSGNIDVGTIDANVGVLVLPFEDGRYGVDSKIRIRYLRNYVFGVLASGQLRLDCSIQDARGYLWPDPDRIKNSHAFYANRSMFRGSFMRLLSPKVRIGKSRAVPMGGATEGMHPTAKFTGSWNIDYECLNDQNPGGALDENMSCGLVRVKWKHPGGKFQNPTFTGFRLMDGGDFGPAPFDLGVIADIDDRLAPNREVPSIAVHVKGGKISSLGVTTTGKFDRYSFSAGFNIGNTTEISK